MLNDPLTKNLPILIFANKQDLPNAAPSSGIVESLKLRQNIGCLQDHDWYVQPSSAAKKQGIVEGMETFSKTVKHFVKSRA